MPDAARTRASVATATGHWAWRLLVVIHSALLMLWLAPSSPIRDLVGSRNLASYVDPYFQQDVDTVDPSVQFVDESFQIRALVERRVGEGQSSPNGSI